VHTKNAIRTRRQREKRQKKNNCSGKSQWFNAIS